MTLRPGSVLRFPARRGSVVLGGVGKSGNMGLPLFPHDAPSDRSTVTWVPVTSRPDPFRQRTLSAVPNIYLPVSSQ
jgi:hypothetical protein